MKEWEKSGVDVACCHEIASVIVTGMGGSVQKKKKKKGGIIFLFQGRLSGENLIMMLMSDPPLVTADSSFQGFVFYYSEGLRVGEKEGSM